MHCCKVANIYNSRFFKKPKKNQSLSSPRKRNIINPQQGLDRLGRQLHRTRTDQQRLQHLLLGDIILDATTPNTDARIPVPTLVPMSQLRHDADAIETRILRQGGGHDLHRVGKGLPADGLEAGLGLGLVAERLGDGDLGRAPTRDQGLLLDEAADDAEGVVEAALGFVEDEAVGAADDDADRLPRQLVRDAGEFDDARARAGGFFQEVGGAELVFGEGVDVGDGFAPGGLDRGVGVGRVRKWGEGGGRTLQMNSTSSRSMSLMARMLSLARKCRLRSLTASRRMDFWMRRTLHFAFLIFLTMSRRYFRSSLRILSICL